MADNIRSFKKKCPICGAVLEISYYKTSALKACEFTAKCLAGASAVVSTGNPMLYNAGSNAAGSIIKLERKLISKALGHETYEYKCPCCNYDFHVTI